jgi:hypothetical protein
MKKYTTPEVCVRRNTLRASILAGSTVYEGRRNLSVSGLGDGEVLKGAGKNGGFTTADPAVAF